MTIPAGPGPLLKRPRLDKLEALRGFTALYVVLFHVLPQKIIFMGINVGILFRFGSESVIIFFVLSGFVIKYTYEKSRDKSFGYYFIRRFIRLYVPLVVMFLIGYLLKSYREDGWTSPEWMTLLGNFFMLQDVITLKPNVVSGTYLNNGVLWSLSYEWWFYMFFFFLVTKIDVDKLKKWVPLLTITAAITYLLYPFIVNRLLMYFAIWWTGVVFADKYLAGEKITIKSVMPQAYLLFTIIAILLLNLYLHRSASSQYAYPLAAYPIVELRHFVFAPVVLFGAIIWQNLKWFGFNQIFGIFKFLAPCSYVMYISHDYLVVEANYLKFINNSIIEHTIYIIVMIAFSFFLEVFFYNKIKRLLIG